MRRALLATTAALLIVGSARADDAVEEAVALFRSQRHGEASQRLLSLAEDQELAQLERSRARYYLARSLHGLGLTEAAQLELLSLMRAGPADPYFSYALPGLLAIARQTGDPAPLLPVIDAVDPAAQPPRARPSVHYLQGLGAWERGELSRAVDGLGAVPDDSDLYPRARYLLGLVLVELGEQSAATGAFQEAVRAQPARADRQEAAELAELGALATLQLGRIYDDLGDRDQAEQFYAQVPRGSGAWDDALEAMARIDLAQADPAAALRRSAAASWPVSPSAGPRSASLPRSAEILHAQALQALCRPAEAQAMLRHLEARAVPLRTELAQATAAHRDEQGAWTDGAAAWEAWLAPLPTDPLAPALLGRLMGASTPSRLVRHQGRIAQEIALLDAQDPRWRDGVGALIRQRLEAHRDALQAAAGLALLDAMAELEEELGTLLTLSEATQLASAAAGSCEEPSPSQAEDPDAWDPEPREADTLQSWPFNGEIWADEL